MEGVIAFDGLRRFQQAAGRDCNWSRVQFGEPREVPRLIIQQALRAIRSVWSRTLLRFGDRGCRPVVEHDDACERLLVAHRFHTRRLLQADGVSQVNRGELTGSRLRSRWDQDLLEKRCREISTTRESGTGSWQEAGQAVCDSIVRQGLFKACTNELDDVRLAVIERHDVAVRLAGRSSTPVRDWLHHLTPPLCTLRVA